MAERECGAGWRVMSGVREPLGEVLGHRPVDGISRLRLLDRSFLPDALPHCAVHIVSKRYAADPGWGYAQPHAHDCDELNIILSETASLCYRYEADGRETTVESPSTVFLRRGTIHRMGAAGGTGISICIHLPRGDRNGA